MCSFLAVIVCIVGGINIAVTIHENEATENILNILSDNDGKFPKIITILNPKISTKESLSLISV